MRKYWVLATGWDQGVWPNDELWQILAGKAGEMMLAGQAVLGTLGTREFPLGVPDANGNPKPWLPDWRQSWIRNYETPTREDLLSDSFSPTRLLRIFTSEAAALEFADFVLGYGANFARILSEEEVEEISPLPADEYIDAMIVDPTDTARIADLTSKMVTLDMMRQFRENEQASN